MARRDPNELTDREREVLELLRRDFTNEQIAQQLGISLDGAKYHVSQILSKLGVATREEAAAVALGERRRWWAGWPLWAKIAGAATMVAAAAGVALLAWGVLRTSEASPKLIDDPPMSVEQIGSYDDPNNFRGFAEQFSQALESRDVDWFAQNTHFVDFECRPSPSSDPGSPPPQAPHQCIGDSAPITVPAVHIVTAGDYDGDAVDTDELGYAAWFGWDAGSDEYREIIQRFVNEFDEKHSDGYGGGRPHLHSYGLHNAAITQEPQTVIAMTTTISSLSVRGNSVGFPRRLLVEFQITHDGQRWAIERLWYTADNRFIATDLDPASDLAKRESGGQQLWAYWQRWQPPSTP